MSQILEESPVSDTKMDISETTTSQESPIITPDCEKEPNFIHSCASLSVSNSQINSDNRKLIVGDTDMRDDNNTANLRATNSTLINNTNRDVEMEAVSNEFSNRYKNENHLIDNCFVCQIEEEQEKNEDNNGDDYQLESKNSTTGSRSGGLTLVNSHPLMSPPGIDSDSENQPKQFFTYPDVVPKNEQPLRLAKPLTKQEQNQHSSQSASNRITSTTNLFTKQTTSSISSSTLDVVDNNPNDIRKISTVREPSPEYASSGSEQDLSQFQATVSSSFQAVTLVSNNASKILSPQSPKSDIIQRRIPLSSDLLSDDISSIESLSNRSFDDDNDDYREDPNVISRSPSSSVFDDTGFNDKEEMKTPTNTKTEAIPQYSASEEARDSRNWQKITLPDGKTREIDMKVIEPYKRVLSHGGYLKAGGHNAIVIFSACYLPDRSRADYHYVMDSLFLYVVKTLEQLVTEDYVMVYLHGGSCRGNVPPFPWLRKCYQLLDRRLRKSLKNLYLVHPTFWLKSIVWMSRPFISSKFWRKLIYVKNLEELYSLVPIERTAVPDKVKSYDSKYL